ncbi:MAG: class IV adenylate cyclase [Candidatus Woesearchaeota archaeon]|jgi:adenylate cyclase class 2
MPIETEVKIKIDAVEPIKQKLLGMKAELYKKRALQTDLYFGNKKLRKNGQTLKIRDNAIFTYKGPAEKKKNIRSNEEIEIMIDNAAYLQLLLEKLGYVQYWKKERYRESYLINMTQICIDETPMGNFIEIEGKKENILDIAKRLGFSQKDFSADGYGKIWREYAKKNKCKGDMVFKK